MPTTAFAACLGLIVGSFLNVVVARLPAGKSVVRPGSRCPKCGHSLPWFENVPVLSWLALRGRCRSCRAPISPRYPVIELLTAFLFVAAEMKFGWGPWLFLRDWPFLALLVAITFIDVEHWIIPDQLSLGGLMVGLASAWIDPRLGFGRAAAGAALGFGLFYGFAWLYRLLSGRSGLGGGDVKLLAMLGAFLGAEGVFATILVSSILGSLLGITWALAQRKNRILRTSIPYGPFLAVGGLYYHLLGDLLWFRFTTPI